MATQINTNQVKNLNEAIQDTIAIYDDLQRKEQRAVGVFGKDYSVFQASASFDETEQAILLEINATGTNDPLNVPVGQRRFNNITREGNKAIYGISKLTNSYFSDFRKIEFSQKIDVVGESETSPCYLNIIVNPTNDGISANNRIIVCLPTLVGSIGSGRSKYRANYNDSSWTLVGAPTGGLSSTPASLATFFATYPDAVIVDNGKDNDNGMPYDTLTYGVLFVIGGSTNGASGPFPYTAKVYLTDITILSTVELPDQSTYVPVEANTDVLASPNIITDVESSTVFTNEGATAKNYHTLPTAVAGLTYTFYVDDTDGMRITANTGDIIQINGVASNTEGYCDSTSIGSSVTLTAINATDWVATSSVGTWDLG